MTDVIVGVLWGAGMATLIIIGALLSSGYLRVTPHSARGDSNG